MRIIHIVPSISEEASGATYAVVRLCESLIETGEDLTLAALDWSPPPPRYAFLKTFPLGIGPRRLGRSPDMCRWLMRETADGPIDVIHNHGMWQMNAIYPGWVARRRKTRLVVSPHGAFSAWAMRHGSPFKKIFWPLLQRPALQQASCFHATAEMEYEDIRRLGFKQPVAVIPNGIDTPDISPKSQQGIRTVLFLGRIHPKKGVDILLNAWAAVMERFPDWDLQIVGPDNRGYLAEMQVLAAQLRLERVAFPGVLYGEEKLRAYREASLFVLPTHSENFGITVAEALAAGTPAIVTKGAPWDGLEPQGAGWWIDIGIDALVASLEEAMAKSPDELAQNGMNGREWMIREFSWQAIGEKMDCTYRWLIEGGEVPSWVRID